MTQEPILSRRTLPRWHAGHLARLHDAVDGVALTDRDRRLVEWLAEWDTETVDAVAGLLGRVREGPQEAGR